VASTYEKMQAFAAELRTQAISDTSEEMSGFVELVQLAGAVGVDLFDYIIPDDPAHADMFVDQLLALFMRVRGDDLPPFDPNLYGEALAVDDGPAAMLSEEISEEGSESDAAPGAGVRPHETAAGPQE